MHLLPLADTGDWSDGITITEISLAETPPLNNNVTRTIPEASMPTKFGKENSTTSSVIENIVIVKQLSGEHYYTLNRLSVQ